MRMGTYNRTALMRRMGLHTATGPILDIGGYDGYWAAGLTTTGPRIVVDLNPRPMHASVAYVCADGQALPFRDGAFATAFAFDVIEHVDDDERLVAEALRVLRPGGRLVMTTPNENVRIFPAFLQPWANRRWGHTRVAGYRPDELRRIVTQAGARDVVVVSLARRAAYTAYLPLRLLWSVSERAGRRAVDFCAKRDARRLQGEHGSVLVQATR